MRDWELVDSDRFSFEDSDRFEEDSLCSWISEPESLCNNWRGWKRSNYAPIPNTVFAAGANASTSGPNVFGPSTAPGPGIVAGGPSKVEDSNQRSNLVELAAKCVASHIPFEMVERFYPPVPEQLQLRIAFWSFPEHEEDIRLYSCLANGSAEEFMKGERLIKSDSVSDVLQIGFHLSATVKPTTREAHKVAVTFDRRRITTCTCSCNSATNWCGHVVAVCLHRIFHSKDVTLRAPVSESLSRLHRDQLQKFAQYLISELPQQILPTAQRLLDELLSSQRSQINTLRGAPDPTAGASAHEQTAWFLDEKTLHGNIHKILIKFCVPAPIVFSDVNYLSSAAPPASAEWSSLLRPLRGREPEGMWNLLSIVREMFRREDRNAIPLLEVITEECLNCDQILVWWFNTKVALHNGSSGHGGKHHSVNSNAHACQHAGSSLCDEIVVLWRLAALNPGISPEERNILLNQFKEWHMKIVEKVSKSRNASVGSKHANSLKNDVEIFPGFRPAVEACYLTWECYPIHGVTYSESSKAYHCPFMCFRHSDGHSRSGDTGMIHSSHAVLNNPVGEHHLLHSSATISAAPGITKRPRSVDCTAIAASVPEPGTSRSTEPMPGPSTATTASMSFEFSVPGPSGSGKSGKGKARKARGTAGLSSSSEKNHGLVSASGLKPKNEVDVVADGEIPGPSSGNGGHSGNSKVSGIAEVVCSNLSNLVVNGIENPILVDPEPIPPLLPPAGRIPRENNRGSISSQSEGFCDNENEIENEEVPDPVDNDNDEGVVDDAAVDVVKVPLSIPPSLSQSQSLNTTTSDENDCEIVDGDVDNDADADSDSSVFTGKTSHPLPLVAAVLQERKFDSSDSQSQHSGDEYQLYYYDTKGTPAVQKKDSNSSSTDETSSSGPKGKDQGMGAVFSNMKEIDDPWDVLFARAEGLHAHGHSKEACKLGAQLAGDLLANPPRLTIELPAPPIGGKGKRKKINPISHQVSCLASATLAKCAFLCTVLAENPSHHYLAFQVGMFGLELARPPAATKPLEVKLANQEAELALLLKRIPVGARELEMMREKAESLKNGTFKSRGEALLPLVLANFIFDVLVMPVNREGRCTLQTGVYHLPTDEMLGFDAAVAGLGLKANVSEAEHPLLCEGTRRQKGDLVLVMLLHYKDDPEKLAKIMDKLLDREIHQLYKAPLPPAYYSNNPPTAPLLVSSPRGEGGNDHPQNRDGQQTPPQPGVAEAFPPSSPSHASHIQPPSVPAGSVGTPPPVNPQNELSNGNSGSDSSNGADPSEASTTVPAAPNASVAGQASNQSCQSNSNVPPTTNGNGSTASKGRYKGKRTYPVLPNQPSEASAHFMFELAKIVLGKAGGSSNQSLFTQPSNGQNPRGPHRALHMCAFHMGLYALGLHNAVSPNWLSRTYSSHVSWITGQAMEIGAPAIAFLIDTWDSHLTPPEAVTIADRASRGDANMVRAAAELALSCLPFAPALNPNEIHRAILQCKEQSDGMLEKACLTVETAAKGGGVYPEVLFDVARQWFSLYQKHLPLDMDVLNDECVHHDSLITLDSGLVDHMGNCQLVSAQTGLPPINPNNPPPPPPNGNGQGPSGPDMMQMSQPPYPMSGPQVSIPYGQVPYFNPPNFVYGQAVIYQTNAPSTPATSSSFYNQQQPPSTQQQAGSVSVPGYMPPSMLPQYQHQHGPPGHPHPGLPHSMPIQFYPAPMPITSSANGAHMNNIRSAQFFNVNHGGHMGHPQHSNNGPQLTVVASQGHPMNVNMGHVNMQPMGQMSHSHPPHMVIPNGSGMNPPPPQGNPNQQMMGMPQGPMPLMNGRPNQMNNCGAPLYMQAGGGMMPPMLQHSGVGMSCPPPPPGIGNDQPTTSSSHFRGDISLMQGGAHQNGQSAIKIKYLLAAYRVGMLALEALARRVHDDRPQAKFARNPPYGEDVKWLLSISRKLGAQYLQQFCICAVSSISNPFVLHEIILDASMIPTRNNLTWVYQNPRSPLAPLVQKCQQMYFQCLHQKLYHITVSDYEDFVSIVCNAKQAFHLTPDGISQFKEWLTNLRRSKACKKDLWTQITSALQSNSK